MNNCANGAICVRVRSISFSMLGCRVHRTTTSIQSSFSRSNCSGVWQSLISSSSNRKLTAWGQSAAGSGWQAAAYCARIILNEWDLLTISKVSPRFWPVWNLSRTQSEGMKFDEESSDEETADGTALSGLAWFDKVTQSMMSAAESPISLAVWLLLRASCCHIKVNCATGTFFKFAISKNMFEKGRNMYENQGSELSG